MHKNHLVKYVLESGSVLVDFVTILFTMQSMKEAMPLSTLRPPPSCTGKSIVVNFMRILARKLQIECDVTWRRIHQTRLWIDASVWVINYRSHSLCKNSGLTLKNSVNWTHFQYIWINTIECFNTFQQTVLYNIFLMCYSVPKKSVGIRCLRCIF